MVGKIEGWAGRDRLGARKAIVETRYGKLLVPDFLLTANSAVPASGETVRPKPSEGAPRADQKRPGHTP